MRTFLSLLNPCRRLLPVSLSLLCALGAYAQSYQGGIRGTVLDGGGGAMANAKITLIDESTNVSRTTLSTSAGEFVFNSVIPSTYTVEAESPGFKRFDRKGVIVGTQQFVTLDIRLEVGQVTESVQVTEEVPLIDSATASNGQVIDRQKLIDLPNLGRNPFMMARVTPNVVPVGNPAYNRMQDQSGSSSIIIAGGPVRGNNYLLDGVPITDLANRAVIIPSLESVEEMKVQANTYDAEMGRTGGGMFNTYLKSGGNQFHGSLLGYMRQTGWLANTFFNNRNGVGISNQPFRNYGGSFGGPVILPKIYNGKNKTFFWIVFEGYRDTQANSSEFATPTAAEIRGDFSQTRSRAGGMQMIYDPLTTRPDGQGGFLRDAFPGNVIPANRIDTVGGNIAKTFMAPSRAARFFGDPNLSGAAVLPSVADQKTGKIDHQVFSWWRASLSYLRYNSLEPGDTWFPTVSSPAQWRLDRRVDSTQFNNLITVNPTTVLNLRYGFNRFPNYGFQRSQGFNVASLGFSNNFVKDIPSQTFPNIGMENLYSLGTNNNFFYVFHSKNLLGSVSKYIGKHSIKVGADYRQINVDGLDFGNSSGQFSFNDAFTRATPVRATAGTGADLASMLLGYAASGSGFIPTKLYNFVNYYSAWVQDDYRITQKLTLNLGLRYERETGLAERNNALIVGFNRNVTNPLGANVTGVIPRGAVMYAGVNGNSTTIGNPVLNKLSPRLGAAYQVNSKTTIRGGWGLYWGPQILVGSPINPEGYTASTIYVGSLDNNATPSGILSNPFPNGLLRPIGNTRGELTGIGNNLSIPDPASRSTRVQQFSFDVQRQLPMGIALSVGYVGSRTSNLQLGTATININQLETQYLSQGAALNQSVPNPFFGRGGLGLVGGANITRSQLLRPYPSFGSIGLTFSDQNRARYDSLVMRAQKRFSKGLTFLTAWTWSRNMDASSAGVANNLNGGNVGPQNAYDMGSEYGLSNVNTPHRFTTALTYELPFGKGKPMLSNNRALDLIAGGWSINAITILASGFPLQISQNNNNNAVIGASSQRPNATGVSPITSGSLTSRIDNYINPAAFSQAPQFTFGNLSRTIGMRGPGQANWDLSVFKTFSVTERLKAQFRAEALNAMNTPLFRSPNAAFGNSQFGRIQSQANFPRMIQLGVRIFF